VNTVLRLALVAAVAVVLGSGVGLATGPEAAPITQQWRLDGIYLAQARDHGLTGPEGELMATARDICAHADDRTPTELVADVQRRHGISAQDAAAVIAAAVRTRCPQYQVTR
jgi:uncharacterized protein DUF732